MRRTLRREAPSTIGLLADEQDFAAMRRYRTFAFDDHTDYLQQVEGLLRTLAAQGSHTTVALFDPEEYAEFCADTGLDPDTPPAAPASPRNSPPPAPPSRTTASPSPTWSRSSSTKPSARPPGSTPPCSSPASAPAPTAARTSAAPPSTARLRTS